MAFTHKSHLPLKGVCKLLELDKATLRGKCEQYDIKPQRNEVGNWGLTHFDLRKLHNLLYYENKKAAGGRRSDALWA